MKIFLNGNIIDEKEAVVSVYDHGFLYGMGLFETFRTYDGAPFLLTEHLNRLQVGCEELGIQVQLDASQLSATISSLLDVNGLKDAYVRLSVSAGVEALGLPSGDYSNPSTILYVKGLPPETDLASRSKSLQKLKLTRNTPEGSIRHKSFHYMNGILGKRELSSYPWATGAEGLFLTAGGHLAEGLVSNLFFYKDGVLRTPDIQTGILPGITRSHVLKLAQSEGISIEEGLYCWEELLHAEEIFVTNSIQEIVPIKSVFDETGRNILSQKHAPGPITQTLYDIYRRDIG